MFTAHAFAALLALAAPLVARADVLPLTPAPGDSFDAGSSCTTTWAGDSSSTTTWKNMAIELMTGDNLNQIHITTVATGQDGTTSGTFQYTCPQVTPNSAIYFYQFSAPLAANHTWTTRFAIASSSGQTTPPSNATQPDSGDAIPWGIGALVDPSTAVPAPSFAEASGASSGSASVSVAAPATSASPSVAATLSTSSSSSFLTSATTDTSSAPSTTPTTKSTSATNGASVVSFDGRVWMSAAALVFAAFLW